jgi:DNA repair exonuclease SbcCD ATPase subunit
MYLDSSLLVNQKKLEGIENDITCPICQGIINDPYFCLKCQNNFCNKCIKEWEQKNQNCPFRCNNPEYTFNRFLNKIFSKLLKFKCQKGCDEIISYKDVNNHYENCKKEDFKSKYYESQTQVEILKVQIENYNDIQNELNQTQERNEELENELEEVKEEKNSLENKIDELNERIDYLENEPNKLEDLQKDNEDLANELEKEKEKNSFLESEIESLEEEKIDFEESMKISEKFENTNKILIKENKSLKDELQKLKKKKVEV